MGDLTTLVNVKQYLNINDVGDDVLLQRLVTAQSLWFENQIRRTIAQAQYTDTFNGDDGRVRLKTFLSPYLGGTLSGVLEAGDYGFAVNLKNTPVVNVVSVTIDGVLVDPATNMGTVNQTDGYVLHDQGRVELIGFSFTRGVNNCIIVYTAGYALTPPDIEQAVIELVAWRYREKDRIGQLSKTVGGETIAFSPYASPLSVQAVIDAYRRVQV